ncbi:SDR family oxidoreductase [Neolewinella persica]|uniref:SDR family oxidoreductase n=1 Tax=Neolewinella persica TaxID=70998 RepID=UPI000366E2A1|nr:SDR family oxidoreductase [Neolewinella persica]
METSKKSRKLLDKVVWITGASSGIGEQLCYQFAKQGASLIISAPGAPRLERVKANLAADQVAVHILPFDLEQLELLPDKVAKALSYFGKVDILVNNAGIALKDWALSTKLEVDQKVMNINYFGPIVLTKHLLPHMLERDAGQIVVMSSLSGKYGVPKISAYAASKHALHGFFETLRSEIADTGVDISIIIPGIIQTEITAHALKGDGSLFGKVDKTFQKAYPAEKAAEKIVQAVLKRKEETFVGGTEGITLVLNRLSPWLLRRFIRNHPIKKMRKLKGLLSFNKTTVS